MVSLETKASKGLGQKDCPVNVSSPLTQAINLAEKLAITPRPDRIQTLLPLTISQEQVKASTVEIKKALFQTPAGKRYHRTVGQIADTIGISRDYIFKTKKTGTNRKEKEKERRKEVISFLERDDNSYALPSKKDHVKGVQKYALADTMANLHKEFSTENPVNPMSLATFCRDRPNSIKLTHYMKRQVCLCKSHANVGLMCEAIPIGRRGGGSNI